VRLRLLGLALLAWLCTGCLSNGDRQVMMVCDPSVTDRCVPRAGDGVRESETEAPSTRAQRESRGAAPALPGTRSLEAPERGLSWFAGRYFSVAYPRGWRVETAEARKRSYLDTTIRSLESPDTYIRVDVTLRLGESDPARHARRAESYLRGQPGYRRIDFRPTTFGSFRALRGEFTVLESGVLLRKVDVFITDAQGHGFAILTQAPSSEYRARAPLFERLRSSLLPRAGASAFVRPLDGSSYEASAAFEMR
jgi:hypothetical protein